MDTNPMSANKIRGGFTILEILVVIGIVGLLLAILLPALSSARSRARAVQCSANQRQVGATAELRALDSGGFLPLAGMIQVPASTSGLGSLPNALNDSDRQRYVYVRRTGLDSSGPPTGEVIAPLPAALAPYAGVDSVSVDDGLLWGWDAVADAHSSLGIFRCPSADSDTGTPPELIRLVVGDVGYSFAWDVRMDFALNESVLGFDARDPGGRSRARGHVARLKNAAGIAIMGDVALTPRPTPLLCWRPTLDAEGTITLKDVLEESPRILPSAPLDTFRHRGRANILFVDGHVESVPIEPESLDRVILRSAE